MSSRLRHFGAPLVVLLLAGCRPDTSVPPEPGAAATEVVPSANDGGRTGSSDALPDNLIASRSVDSHRRMIEELSALRDSALREGNEYFAAAPAEQLQAALSALPPGTPRIEKFRLLSLLGIRQLLMGDIDESIRNLTEAYEMVDELEGQLDQYPIRLPLLLGLAHLQKGEEENCVLHHTMESCLFPVREGGIHSRPDGARGAIPYLRSVLQRRPQDMTAVWLLNLAHMLIGEHPDQVEPAHRIPAQRFQSAVEFPRFPDVAAERGVNTFSHCGGAVADDFDGDGWLDLIVSNWDPAGQLRFYSNQGDGTFRERTADAGLTGILGGLNLIHADYDNDGDLDLLVLRGAWLGPNGQYPNSLLQNDGRGRFRDVTFDVGLGDTHYPTQTGAWADYDNDGDLDLYIGNENFPNQLFQNDGSGRFTDVAGEAGVENMRRAKAVVWGDYDGDSFPDIYVSNQGHNNRLYHNNGDGTFRDVAVRVGVSEPVRSFPAWFWDFNNDGALDIFAASYNARVQHIAAAYLNLPQDSEPARLYQGDGQGGFREVAAQQGIVQPTAPMGSNFGDLDHDGFVDFYLGTGYPELEEIMPNLMYRNRGGAGFEDVTVAGGFGHLQKGHGVVFADFDHDGDQDVFIEMGGAYRGDAFWDALFENPGSGNHWIGLKLVGVSSNRCGIGARIRLVIDEGGRSRSIYRWVNSGGSFGANPLRQQIGTGSAAKVRELEVFWPTTGVRDRFEDVGCDQFLVITEGQEEYELLEIGVTEQR